MTFSDERGFLAAGAVGGIGFPPTGGVQDSSAQPTAKDAASSRFSTLPYAFLGRLATKR